MRTGVVDGAEQTEGDLLGGCCRVQVKKARNLNEVKGEGSGVCGEVFLHKVRK